MSLTKEDLKNIKDIFKDEFISINNNFKEIGKKFKQIDNKFEQIDKRFEQIDKRFEQIDIRFEQIELRLTSHESIFLKIYNQLDSIEDKVINLVSKESINSEKIDRLELEVDNLKRSKYSSVYDKD